ncbi:hypothetical protein DITRI_Ditri12bG0090700 [Diplodiscus trichospermus]
MVTCDVDPDVLRWGLQDLLCVFSHSGASAIVTRHDKDNGQTGYIREGCHEPERVNVENDAVIARALQDEFSRVAAAEASGFTNPSQDSILAQVWFTLPGRRHSSDHEDDGKIIENWNQTERNTNEVNLGKQDLNHSVINRCEKGGDSGLGNQVSLGEDMLHIDGIDRSSVLGGEVEKRLNDMVAIPHVPKINGEIPSADEEISDHQRLLDRLQLYGVVENTVQGDGNCQFRSLSDQLYRSQDHHRFVRQQVVSQLKSNPEMYEGYVPMAYGDYLKKMNKNGEWGDHVTLQAAADSYGVKIFVLTSFKDTCYIEILPHYQKSERSEMF